ncbi:MAG: hypothetical protein OHK0036_06380 [Bacteroidia bacterium]
MILHSCLKKELPVPPHTEGSVQTVQIPLTSNYKYQIFFSLKNNQIVQQQLKTCWDIAFECGGSRVILNSSKFMFAYNTNKTSFSQVTDTSGFSLNKKYDSPTRNLDSTAIGNWWENLPVYIIHRGFNESGTNLGYIKLKIISFNYNQFTFLYGNISDTAGNIATINTDTNYRFIGFNFSTQQKVYIEPPKNQWDLLFTQYTEHLSEPYLVTGCLLNIPLTKGYITSQKFEDINYNIASNMILSTNANIIGYTWKEYDFNTSSYVVHPEIIYIIKDNENYFYKLRFIGFYSSSGEKGYPKFEFQRL